MDLVHVFRRTTGDAHATSCEVSTRIHAATQQRQVCKSGSESAAAVYSPSHGLVLPLIVVIASASSARSLALTLVVGSLLSATPSRLLIVHAPLSFITGSSPSFSPSLCAKDASQDLGHTGSIVGVFRE